MDHWAGKTNWERSASRKPGRPSKITSEHLKVIKEFIRKCEVDEKDPPEPYEVCDFIESTLGITYSWSWINQLINNSNDIFLVDATPLEDARINVKEEDLQNNH